jgi:phosphate-selective porin OprO/OprP
MTKPIDKFDVATGWMKVLVLAVAALAAPAGVPGAQDASPVPSPSAAAASPAPSPAPDRGSRASAGAEGFVIESADGDFRLQVRGYAQFDGRFYPGEGEPAAGTDSFLPRRVRPILQGRVGRHFAFNLTPDFGGGTAVLQDAYLDVRPSSKIRVRVGKFKAPVGLERLQSAASLALVERALPTALVPNRDVGAMVHGELASGVVAYAAGVFNGARDGGSLDGDTNDGKDLAARLFLSPFKRSGSALRNLGFGIAGTTGRQEGAVPVYRTGGQAELLTYAPDVVAGGTRTRLAPQLSFYRGPFGLMAEFVRSRSELRRGRVESSSDIRVDAWQATASLCLTGEPASYAGARPRGPWDPATGRWGAVELAARVNGIEVDGLAFSGGFSDPSVSARKAFAWGLGLNWHLTRNVKQSASFERTSFTGGAPGGSDRPAENALFLRTQVAF